MTLHTTLNVTGRPAQFGRGVIAEVGSRLIDKFADNLAHQLANGGVSVAAPADASTTTASADASTTTASADASTTTASAGGTAATAPAPGDASPDARSSAPAPSVPAPSVPAPSVPAPSVPAPSVPAPSAPAATAQVPSAPAPSVPAPSVPAPSVPAPSAPAATAQVPVPSAPEPMQPVHVQHQDEHLDLLSLVGPVIVKRLAPLVGAAAAVGLLTWGTRRLLRRRRSA